MRGKEKTRQMSGRTVTPGREGGKERNPNVPKGHLRLGREDATAYGLFAAGELLDAGTNTYLTEKGKRRREGNKSRLWMRWEGD